MTDTTPDTAPASTPGPEHCPRCDHVNVFALSGGNRLCGDCRHEWNTADPYPIAAAPGPDDEPDAGAIAQAAGAHITHVDVTVQDLDTLHTEVRHHVVMTVDPHTEDDAHVAARGAVLELLEGETAGAYHHVLASRVSHTSQPFADDDDDGDALTSALAAAYAERAVDTMPALHGAPTGSPVFADQELPDDTDPLAHLLAHEVVTASGEHVIVREFVDDDTVLVEDRRGRKIELPIESLVEDVTARRAGAGVAVDMDDDEARALAATYLLMAALTIEAGTAMVDGTGPAATVGVAPSGWLPFDTDEAALIEQGAACAVAALVRGFDLPRETVAMIATTLRIEAQPGDQTEGNEQ